MREINYYINIFEKIFDCLEINIVIIMNIRTYLWCLLTNAYPAYLRWRYKMDIGKNCRISWKTRFDTSINPKGIHIGDNVWILSNAVILAHDHCRDLKS